MIQYIIILFIFLFCSSLFLYKITNKLLKNIIKILNKNKCPTIYGVLIHSIIFFILFRFFLQFNNTKENIDLETTELDTKEDKSLNEQHSHIVKIPQEIEYLINPTSIADYDVNEFLEDLNDEILEYGETKEDMLIDLCNNIFNNSEMWNDEDNNLQANWNIIKQHNFENISVNLNNFDDISFQNIEDKIIEKNSKQKIKETLKEEISDLDISINQINSQLNN